MNRHTFQQVRAQVDKNYDKPKERETFKHSTEVNEMLEDYSIILFILESRNALRLISKGLGWNLPKWDSYHLFCVF